METLNLLLKKNTENIKLLFIDTNLTSVKNFEFHHFIKEYLINGHYANLEDFENLAKSIDDWPASSLFEQEKYWLILTFSQILDFGIKVETLSPFINTFYFSFQTKNFLVPDDLDYLFAYVKNYKNLLLPYFLTSLSYLTSTIEKLLKDNLSLVSTSENKTNIKSFLIKTNERIEFLIKLL